MKATTLKPYLAWASVCVFWGTTYLAIRVGVESLPPALFAGTRFLLAGLLFLPILRLRGYALPSRRDLKDLAVVGLLLLGVGNGTLVWAEQWVPSGLAALIVATLPFWTVALEALLPHGAKWSLGKVLGIVVGFGGLLLLLWPERKGALNPAFLKGVFILFLATVSWGAGSLYAQYRRVTTAPLMAAAVQMLLAGAVMTGLGLALGEAQHWVWDWRGLAALAYLLVFGSLLGYVAYIYALAHLPAAFVSTYAYVNPVIAVFLGWLLLGERLDAWMLLGTAAILLGVLLVRVGSFARGRPFRRAVQPQATKPEVTEIR